MMELNMHGMGYCMSSNRDTTRNVLYTVAPSPCVHASGRGSSWP